MGLPLKIDKKTMDVENGIFTRVIVNVDLINALLGRVLVKREGLNFFVNSQYEKIISFCGKHLNICHSLAI